MKIQGSKIRRSQRLPLMQIDTAGRMASDVQLTEAVLAELSAFSGALVPGAPAVALLETAGGVSSPSPSGRVQVRNFRAL